MLEIYSQMGPNFLLAESCFLFLNRFIYCFLKNFETPLNHHHEATGCSTKPYHYQLCLFSYFYPTGKANHMRHSDSGTFRSDIWELNSILEVLGALAHCPLCSTTLNTPLSAKSKMATMTEVVATNVITS